MLCRTQPRHDQRRRQHQMHDRGAPDLGPGQSAQVELKADREQKERHPQIGDRLQAFGRGEADQVEAEPRQQKAHHGRQTDPRQHHPENEGEADKRGEHDLSESGAGCGVNALG